MTKKTSQSTSTKVGKLITGPVAEGETHVESQNLSGVPSLNKAKAPVVLNDKQAPVAVACNPELPGVSASAGTVASVASLRSTKSSRERSAPSFPVQLDNRPLAGPRSSRGHRSPESHFTSVSQVTDRRSSSGHRTTLGHPRVMSHAHMPVYDHHGPIDGHRSPILHYGSPTTGHGHLYHDRPLSVYRSPIYKGHGLRHTSLDRQAGTVLVERRYDPYQHSVRYTPRSPPRPQRILDLGDPFVDHYSRRLEEHHPEVIHRIDSSVRSMTESIQDRVSLHAPSHDPLIREDESRTLDRETQRSPTIQTNNNSDSESQSSDLLPDNWSMDKAVNEVFRVLPEKLCPRITTAPKHVNRSGLEELNNEEIPEIEVLPQANIVRNMIDQLQASRPLDSCTSGWTVPSALAREHVSPKIYNMYAVSQEHLPVKPPPLDSEALTMGMSFPSSINVPYKTLERWEARSRMAANIASHSDHFIATLDRILKDENVSSLSVNRIMSALDKSKTKILGLSLHSTAEMLSLRRDATLDAKSTSLLKGSKDMLRAAPLSAKTLFNGKVKEVTAADLAEQTRLGLQSSFSGNRKRPAPSSLPRHKNKKAKVVQQSKPVFVKPNVPKKQFSNQQYSRTQQRPKYNSFKAAPSVPKAQP